MKQNTERVLRLVWILIIAVFAAGQQTSDAGLLVQQFNSKRVFWQQFEIAKKIVALRDKSVLPKLEPWLSDKDRHLRGNAAFIFGGLGDERGLQIITAILNDWSDRPQGQGIPADACAVSPEALRNQKTPVCWSLRQQISSDRYHAAHLLGDLEDRRAVPILIPLLNDPDVDHIVPWSLGKIGDRTAIPPLIEQLSNNDPDLRVLAIHALQTLKAKEALPQIQTLASDNQRIRFDGLGTVAEAAKAAIAVLRAAQ